ncbi:hypothetical protein WN48_03497 [Eufriesea mexicana]|uniref:Uncharacterized protein n=1 Tax=Eufriesea mexicana TaxID=516756 RepID=A0A310SF97_9HYME|nr:hypothetical protein WN48_03497 [Eufriesea mexicana]
MSGDDSEMQFLISSREQGNDGEGLVFERYARTRCPRGVYYRMNIKWLRRSRAACVRNKTRHGERLEEKMPDGGSDDGTKCVSLRLALEAVACNFRRRLY